MRIGIISDTLYPKGKGTGQSRYLSNILTYLRAIDKENEYILFHKGASPNPFYDQYEHVEYGKYASRLPLPFFVSWEVALAKALRLHPVDLMHEPACNGLPLLSWSRRNAVTLMDVMSNLFPREFAIKGVVEFRTRLPAILWKTDCVISPSENSRRDIERVFHQARGKVKVVPLGLTPDFGRKGEGEIDETLSRLKIDRPYILMHAVHRWNKNTKGAVETFDKAVKLAKAKDYQLVLSGGMSKELESEMRTLASKLGLAERVVLTGFVSDDSVPSLISGATAFLYPTFYEGFGFPVLEAMTCGAPIVASSIPTTIEVLGDAGLTALPEDADTLARHLVSIMTDRTLAANLGARALERSRRFTAERMTRETVQVYREVVAKNPKWRV